MTFLIGAAPTSPGPLVEGRGFGLGDRYTDQNGSEFVYVQATTAVTGAGYVVTIDEAYQAVQVTTALAARGDMIGVAPAAFAASDFGWVQVKGPCQIRVAASCAANVRLNTTATAGQIDDDGTASSVQIQGAYLTTARGAGAGNAAGMLNYPFLDATL